MQACKKIHILVLFLMQRLTNLTRKPHKILACILYTSINTAFPGANRFCKEHYLAMTSLNSSSCIEIKRFFVEKLHAWCSTSCHRQSVFYTHTTSIEGKLSNQHKRGCCQFQTITWYCLIPPGSQSFQCPHFNTPHWKAGNRACMGMRLSQPHACMVQTCICTCTCTIYLTHIFKWVSIKSTKFNHVYLKTYMRICVPNIWFLLPGFTPMGRVYFRGQGCFRPSSWDRFVPPWQLLSLYLIIMWLSPPPPDLYLSPLKIYHYAFAPS